jgi:hypothetical protein
MSTANTPKSPVLKVDLNAEEMRQSVKRLIDFLRLWNDYTAKDDEAFWHSMFNQHSYVLPQMFSVPAVLIGDRVSVGGTAVDTKDARFVDYLFAGETSKDALWSS